MSGKVPPRRTEVLTVQDPAAPPRKAYPVSFRLGHEAESQLAEIVQLSPHRTDRTDVLRRLIAAEVARLRRAAKAGR